MLSCRYSGVYNKLSRKVLPLSDERGAGDFKKATIQLMRDASYDGPDEVDGIQHLDVVGSTFCELITYDEAAGLLLRFTSG